MRPKDYPRETARLLKEKPSLKEAVGGGTRHFDANRQRAYREVDAEALREWARRVKDHLLSHLDHYLEKAEAALRKNGAQVHWALDREEAQRILAHLVQEKGVKRAVKAKSMLSEELGINPLLEGLGVEVFETDLGEYILQLLGEPPSHIVGPAIHLSLAEIQELFHKRFQTPKDAPPEALAQVARKTLREAFLTADLGISGANFLVAETGTIVLMENEGNIRLSTSLPRVHVALVGIEKLLPRLGDLAHFLSLTARAATGQRLSTYVSLIQGPAKPDEEGPEEVHVILVDNGRTALLADPEAWETLRCLRCGACLNACPVYRQTGGHPYGYAYSGPIGAVLNPGLLGLEETYPLPYASTLCGACLEACPVKIPIPNLLLTWRRRAVEEGLSPFWERAAMEAFAQVMTHPGLYRIFSKGLRGLPVLQSRVLPLIRAWAQGRSPLKPSPRPFHELWEEI